MFFLKSKTEYELRIRDWSSDVCSSDLAYSLFGIWIESVQDVRVLDNLITGKRDYASAQRGNGIQLFNSNGAQVIGNRISYVRDGIYVAFSDHAIFRNNRIHDARYGAHYMNSHDNLWESKDSYPNRGGLALLESRTMQVRNNRAWDNTDQIERAYCRERVCQ